MTINRNRSGIYVYQSPRRELEEVADTVSTEEENEEEEEYGAERKERRLRKRVPRYNYLYSPGGEEAAIYKTLILNLIPSPFLADSLKKSLFLSFSLFASEAHQCSVSFRLIV